MNLAAVPVPSVYESSASETLVEFTVPLLLLVYHVSSASMSGSGTVS
jgi:hypothetical protein